MAHTYFPIGDIEKPEVRRIADELNLPVAKKKDSTGICFIGERNFREFLKNYLPSQDGDIIDIHTLKKVGNHIGVLYYTIGQRKGLGIGGNMGPWFVVGKDVEKNILYVANGDDQKWLYSDSCLVSGVNWLGKEKPVGEFACTAKFRYRQNDHDVVLRFLDETTAFVSYPQKVSSVTCGQEAVFYCNEVCLGGGVIEDVYLENESLNERIKRYANE